MALSASLANTPARPSLDDLKEWARINRIDTADMFMAAGNGHFGSCYSCTEIVTVLYFAHMRIDATNPEWPDRDRFVMGKGHAAPTLYSALIRRGFLPEDWIGEFENRVGARLMTHPSRRYQPGVDTSGGSLGHGLSVGVGMALAAQMDKRDFRVYCLMGDGETNEGSVWEAAASASKFGLCNLVGIIDRNRFSVDGPLDDVMSMEPMADKWRAFGWEVVEINGHDIPQLLDALAPRREQVSGKPRMVIADTVKGRGISFMENVRSWHADLISPEQYAQVRRELEHTL